MKPVEPEVEVQFLKRWAGTAEQGGRFLKLHSLPRLVNQSETGTGAWHGWRRLRPLPLCHFGIRGTHQS